ncbi:MAG: amidohydrolase family protein [Clostridia bacterium]|jgi:predicted TIM-barrel fold metal-dependent hydrolase|nr:amidohydrolase family protein [Clostridia bacterium]
MSNYKIFANHAHVFPKGSKDNAQLENLKELMAECDIEKAVCFAPFNHQTERVGITINQNKWLYEEIKNENNLIGFGTINFDIGSIQNQVKEIKTLGFKGIKIHPAAQEVRVDGRELFEVYAEAEKQGLFISFHTGLHWHRIKDYSMLLFDEVAYNFPDLKFSMEHVGGYSFFKEALLVMNNNSRKGNNIYAGLTSVAMETDALGNTRSGAWSLTDDEICDLIHQTGEENSIIGLDFPYKNVEYTKNAIERIKNLPITENAKKGILGENLMKALNLKW